MLEAGGHRIEKVSAFTALTQDYLPPVDTINAILRTESGVSGTVQLSFGTTLRGNEWTIACENGVVSVTGASNSEVTIMTNGQRTVLSLPNERTGVPPEVRAWGEALAKGTVLKAQDPEPARADLELVSPHISYEYSKTNINLDRANAQKWRARRRAYELPLPASLDSVQIVSIEVDTNAGDD